MMVNPDSKVHGPNMGPIWVRQDPGGPHVGHMNLAIWVRYSHRCKILRATQQQRSTDDNRSAERLENGEILQLNFYVKYILPE